MPYWPSSFGCAPPATAAAGEAGFAAAGAAGVDCWAHAPYGSAAATSSNGTIPHNRRIRNRCIRLMPRAATPSSDERSSQTALIANFQFLSNSNRDRPGPETLPAGRRRALSDHHIRDYEFLAPFAAGFATKERPAHESRPVHSFRPA